MSALFYVHNEAVLAARSNSKVTTSFKMMQSRGTQHAAAGRMRPVASYFLARDVQAVRLYVHVIAAPATDDHTHKMQEGE